MLLDGHRRRRHGILVLGLDQHDQLPTIDRDFDLVHLAARVGHLLHTGDVSMALMPGRRFQVNGIDSAGHVGSQPPSLGEGPDLACYTRPSSRTRAVAQWYRPTHPGQ